MRYSEMTLMDRKAIFDHQENFPLVVTVGGETSEVDHVVISELRSKKVDFEVDEAQAAHILIKFGTC